VSEPRELPPGANWLIAASCLAFAAAVGTVWGAGTIGAADGALTGVCYGLAAMCAGVMCAIGALACVVLGRIPPRQ